MEAAEITKSFPDHENLRESAAIQKLLDPGETVVYSCKVLKHNRWGMK